MSLTKNQIISLTIENLSSDGSGVGRYDGEAIFVPNSAPQDELSVRIVKDCKKYAFGIIEKNIKPSHMRIQQDCKVATPCGGCCYRHINYEAECDAKAEIVADAFNRIGGFNVEPMPFLPSPQKDFYRNKAQFPVGYNKNNELVTGFYAQRSHNIVAYSDCHLQPQIINKIANACLLEFNKYNINAYAESTHTGLIRHLFLRIGSNSGQIMLCFVCNGKTLPHSKEIAESLCEQFPDIATILCNVNTKKTNVILGEKNHIIYGKGYIEDTLAGVPVQLGPLSFYQVNNAAAEKLYKVAEEFAELKATDFLMDLYCGMGTIGLSMVNNCAKLIGVEIIPEAIESAKENANRMGKHVLEKCHFICADAGTAATKLAKEGLKPDVIIVDPPRKGCDNATLTALIDMAPRRIVMISCNPATAARDAKYLAESGYELIKIQGADFFPRSKHVECVTLMTRCDETPKTKI